MSIQVPLGETNSLSVLRGHAGPSRAHILPVVSGSVAGAADVTIGNVTGCLVNGRPCCALAIAS